MEKVIDELEMISSPLADSEDSLISEMSTKYDVARASWLEMKRWKEEQDEDGDGEMYASPPPVPQKDYSRLRPHVYRRRGEEFNIRRSKSYDKPRPPRPRTPEQHYARNARFMVNKKQKDEGEAVYATPIRRTPNGDTIAPPIIEEFNELPRYVKTEMVEEPKEDLVELVQPTPSTQQQQPPKLDMDSEIEFSSSSSSSKVEQVEQKLKALRLAREDSLSNLLKKQLSKKEKEVKIKTLPVYVEPKDPIIKELQEFLKIEPSDKNSQTQKTPNLEKSKDVEADEHRLVVRGWQNLMKTPSSSTTTSSTSSSSTLV